MLYKILLTPRWNFRFSVTTLVIAALQYFTAVLSIILCKVYSNSWVGGLNPKCNHTNEICVAVHSRWFSLLSFWVKFLHCDHSNESRWAAFSGDSFYYALQTGCNLLSSVMKSYSVTNRIVWPFRVKSLSFLWRCYYTVQVLTDEFEDKIAKCDHSNESYWTVFSCASVCCARQIGHILFICDETY